MPRVVAQSFVLCAAVCAFACAGPEAPDSAVCQDVIVRVCRAPRCEIVTTTLAVGDDCAAVLHGRTGCGSESFAFAEPMPRDRFLSCRLPLIRGGNGIDDPATCGEIEESFLRCPDLATFLGADGGRP